MSARNAPKPGGLRLEWVNAGTLTDNPKNWRRHPPGQLRAIQELIEDPDVGWAGVFLFNEKTGLLIDGHARKQLVSPETPVPVLIGSWSEAAERKILLTLDPIAALATADAASLSQLLDEVALSEENLRPLLDLLEPLSLEEAMQQFEVASIEEQGQLDVKAPITCPKCGHEFTP